MRKNLLYGFIISLIGVFFILISVLINGKDVFTTTQKRTQQIMEFSSIDGDVYIEEDKVPIIISKSIDTSVHVKTFSSESDSYLFNEVGDLSIIAQNNEKWYEKYFVLRDDTKQNYFIEVSVPDDFEIDIKCKNNSVYITDVNLKSIVVESKDACINLNNVNVRRNVFLFDNAGKINIDTLSCRNLEIWSKSAEIDLNNITTERNLEVENEYNSISIKNSICNDELNLRNINGKISLVNIEFIKSDIKTINGSVYVDIYDNLEDYKFDIVTKSGYITLVDKNKNAQNYGKAVYEGSGKRYLDIKTNNGKVIVTTEGILANK